MNSNEIQSKVLEIISHQIQYPAAQINPDSAFESDLGIDSITQVELITKLESAFGIKIPIEEAARFKNVRGTVSYIEKMQNA